MKAPEKYYDFEKDISGCGIFGVINKKRGLIPGEMPIQAMTCMHDRGNGLGGGFAAYGIYPEHEDKYCFHMMCDDDAAIKGSEEMLKKYFDLHFYEPIPTRRVLAIPNPPMFNRYFVTVPAKPENEFRELPEEDYIVAVVMKINTTVPGAFVVSSGKNMGAFKGVGFPEDIADFFRLEEYKAYIWTGHNRFPTNTPGWWGGAHPFTILNWSIVHNGEISLLRHQPPLPVRARLPVHHDDRHRGRGLRAGYAHPQARPVLGNGRQGLRSAVLGRDRAHGRRGQGTLHRAARHLRPGHAQRSLRHPGGGQHPAHGPERPHQAPAAAGWPKRTT